MNDFITRVRDELEYKGLTQKELAELTGISINTIRGWVSKDLVPDVFSAVKVAKALDVPVEYLANGTAPDHPRKARIKELLNEINKLL